MNTPDTEPMNLITVNGEYYVKCTAHEEVVRRIQEKHEEALTSRDTYWKERVIEMIEDVRKDIPKITREPFELAENVGKNIALDTLLDNLK